MSNTQSKPFRHNALQAAPGSSPPTGQGSTVDDAAIDNSQYDDDVLRAIQCVGLWVHRHVGSGELVVTMKAIGTKLDEILERLTQDRTSGQLMSVKAAARFLSLSERTIRERLALRQWPAYRSGNAIRVDPIELKTLMAKESR